MLDSYRRRPAFFLFFPYWVVLLGYIGISNPLQAQNIAIPHDTVPPGLDSSLFHPPAAPLENRVRYSRNVLDQTFDFQLEPISHGKFQINITGGTRDIMSIKVYDVIGNLLYEDEVRIRGFLKKELDLSDYKSNFFIIEIGNDEVNKTKSIVAL